MPAWPGTLEQLRDAGYHYEDRDKCLAPTCQTQVYWFITPKAHWMPFEQCGEANGLALYQPHFATCPEARKFSRKSKDRIEERKAVA